MTKPGLSIIVPVFNAADRINQCVNSLLKQDYQNFELILVNDGSEDQSGNLCDEYSQLDNRIKVIHKKNGGPGSARNAGLNISNGNFIGFVDSDDFIDPKMFSSMIVIADQTNADIIQCGFYKISPDGIVISECKYSGLTISGSLNCLRAFSLHQNISNFITVKIFRKKTIDNIRFPDLYTSEDAVFILYACSKSEKIIILEESFYKYVQHPLSLTKSETSLKHFDSVKGGKLMFDFVANSFPEFSGYWALYTILYIVKLFARSRNTTELKSQRSDLIRDFKIYYPIVRQSNAINEISIKSRVGLFLFNVFPELYAYLYASSH